MRTKIQSILEMLDKLITNNQADIEYYRQEQVDNLWIELEMIGVELRKTKNLLERIYNTEEWNRILKNKDITDIIGKEIEHPEELAQVIMRQFFVDL